MTHAIPASPPRSRPPLPQRWSASLHRLGPYAALIVLGACSDEPLIYPSNFTGQEYVPPAPTPPASTAPPADAHLGLRNDALPWDTLEGHLAWTSGDGIRIASSVDRSVHELTFPTAGSVRFFAGALSLSPDARRLAVTAQLDPTWSDRVFVLPVGDGPTAALSPEGSTTNEYPCWDSDGESVYVYRPSSVTDVLVKSTPDGTAQTPVPVSLTGLGPVSLSPDGQSLAVGGQEIVVAPVDGRAATVIESVSPPTRVLGPVWSPDGTQLAFSSFWPPERGGTGAYRIVVSDVRSREQKVVLDLPDPNSPYPEGVNSCSSLAWSPSGRWLAYFRCTSPDWELRVLDLQSLQSTSIGSGKGDESALSWVP